MDRYTKIVLTVIAGSLLLLNIQLMRNVDFITNAYAQEEWKQFEEKWKQFKDDANNDARVTGGVQKIAICDGIGRWAGITHAHGALRVSR